MAGLLAVTAISSAQAATVLVDDQFNDGGLGDGADPLDAIWTRSAGANGGFTVGAFSSSGNTTNALVNTSGNGFNLVKGSFTNGTALTNGGEGSSITLSFDFRFTTLPAASNAGVRIGLGTGNSGDTFFVGTGGTASSGFAHFNAVDTTSSGVGVTTSPTPTLSINDTLSHSFVMTLTRTGTTSLLYSATIDGNTFTGTSSAIASNSFTFDRILIGEGSAALFFNIDNVNVTLGAIPEPSTYAALTGLSALGLVALQRRRGSR
ncbi:MAG TPA: hypothetical protein VK968_11260 [Roseimicrobium sp.]|nr:hypothetical protein [Roseimicrobium sp.]